VTGAWVEHWFSLSRGGRDLLLETATIVGTIGTLAVLCLMGIGTDRRHWRWVGIALAGVIAGFMLYHEFVLRRGDISRWVAALIPIATVVAHANVVCLIPLGEKQRWIRWLTIAASAATGAMVVVILLADKFHYDEAVFVRYSGATGIVAGCGTLALIVLGRLNVRKEAPPEGLKKIDTISLVCPFCQKTQALPMGRSRCSQCGLVMHVKVEVEEPKCAKCGYSLMLLKSARCPECGEVAGLASVG
ncbi:MAG TPA: hypothetical protein VF669_05125, partial [Tepidisphaeraceae bacterium]|jgi:hypothetical protein